MTVLKPRPNGMRQVFVWATPEQQQRLAAHWSKVKPTGKARKVYIGSRKALRGPGGALELEHEAIDVRDNAQVRREAMTCAKYADRWLEHKHGEGTTRPAPATYEVNRGQLGLMKSKDGKPRHREGSFLAEFGHRSLDSIDRDEALDWAKTHSTAAKVVSAMFNDAVDEKKTSENPFANRRLPQKRGRRDIAPLTEAEVARLAELAVTVWGRTYGWVVAGWITFLAWTGCRPGEASSRRWSDLDLEAGLFMVPRIKGDKQTDQVVLPPLAVRALQRMPVQTPADSAAIGLLFLTPTGKPYRVGSYAYFWGPVRAAFVAWLAETDPARLRELEETKGALDVYALRHFAASIIVARGGNEFDCAAQLGNSPAVCRKHYVHAYRSETNKRNASFLGGGVSDLDAARIRRKGA